MAFCSRCICQSMSFPGLPRLIRDIRFMLDQEITIYWKFCWGLLIPVALAGMFIYSLVDFKPVDYAGVALPTEYQGKCIHRSALDTRTGLRLERKQPSHVSSNVRRLAAVTRHWTNRLCLQRAQCKPARHRQCPWHYRIFNHGCRCACCVWLCRFRTSLAIMRQV